MLKWILLLLILPGSCFAAGSLRIESQPVYTAQGNAAIPYNTSITTTSWTVVISSDIITRGLIIESDPANTVTICISTTTNSNDGCSASTPGVKLSAGGSWTDYSEMQWTARGYTASGATLTQFVTGVRYRDKGDYGNIGSPSQ